MILEMLRIYFEQVMYHVQNQTQRPAEVKLNYLRRHRPQVLQVRLVSDEHRLYVRVRVLLELRKPPLNVFE